VISLDWTLLLQFINFVVLMFILNKILYRPLLKVMAQRREQIDSNKTRAQGLESEIDAKMKRYQQQLADAKSQAATERNLLRKAAQQEESAITAEAQQKAASRIKAIRNQVEQEATEARQILRQSADELAGQIATKVLGRKLV
jgi:F-type H+-transporting ATPase subunit b